MIHPNSINETQRGRARDSVISMWLVEVKMYGMSPMVLFNMMNRNRVTNNMFVPLAFISILNSLWRDPVSVGNNMFVREGESQNIEGITSRPIIELIQFNWRDIIEEEGSNTENRLVIIFRGLIFGVRLGVLGAQPRLRVKRIVL